MSYNLSLYNTGFFISGLTSPSRPSDGTIYPTSTDQSDVSTCRRNSDLLPFFQWVRLSTPSPSSFSDTFPGHYPGTDDSTSFTSFQVQRPRLIYCLLLILYPRLSLVWGLVQSRNRGWYSQDCKQMRLVFFFRSVTPETRYPEPNTKSP